jgi:hypothetical protein
MVDVAVNRPIDHSMRSAIPGVAEMHGQPGTEIINFNPSHKVWH